MKFRVILAFDAVAGSYSAVCPELPGCATFGDTEQEALRNAQEAIRLYLDLKQPAHISGTLKYAHALSGSGPGADA